MRRRQPRRALVRAGGTPCISRHGRGSLDPEFWKSAGHEVLLEANLGLALPADYKLLCELFPALELGNFVVFGGPDPGHEHLWPKGAHEELDIIDEWLGYANLTVPMHTYPAPGGLLPWSTSNEGDIFLWSTGGEGPEEWTVTVASRNGAWWHYDGGVAQFMADLVSGRLELWGLPSVSCEVSA